MKPHEGLIVVLPEHFNKRDIPALLRRHEAWIRKTAALFDAQRLEPSFQSASELPSTVLFSHCSAEWKIEYRHEERLEVALQVLSPDTLLLSGDVANVALCRKLLCLWLKQRAQQLLIPQFEQLATALGFSYGKATVRLQHSRWGSYSSSGVITLNTKLLFLPAHLVRHVMVHELCHTVHQNHSRAFWGLVQQHDPLWRLNNSDMKSAWKYVPAWVSRQTA